MRYELMLILKPLLPQDTKSDLIQTIEDMIGKMTGKIYDTDVWGKRHLAYPIKKHAEGYYIVYKLEISPKKATELDRELAIMNGVLRSLRINLETQK